MLSRSESSHRAEFLSKIRMLCLFVGEYVKRHADDLSQYSVYFTQPNDYVGHCLTFAIPRMHLL